MTTTLMETNRIRVCELLVGLPTSTWTGLVRSV